VVFRPKSLGLYRPTIHVITVTFLRFYVFLEIQKRDILRFLPCFTRFLELWCVYYLQTEF